MKDYSKKRLILNRAKKLRKNAVLPERMLWGSLKKRKFLGLKFRRQFPMQYFILDFYCYEKRLAIQIDGKTHDFDDQISSDLEKEQYLTELGIHLIRISNEEILRDIEAVISWLEVEIKQLPLLSSPSADELDVLPLRGDDVVFLNRLENHEKCSC